MKILIISYYAFPLNAVPSYRIESFCEGFAKEGADVTLLTRHWDEGFNSWQDVLTSNLKEVEIKNTKNYSEIFLPFKETKKDSRFRLLNTLRTFKNYFLGNIQIETDAYTNFKNYALQLIRKENDFDLIYVSAQPYNLIKLGYYLNKQSGVPFIADFRDFLNNKYLMHGNSLSLRERLVNSFITIHVRKWTDKALSITTVSPFLVEIIGNEFKKKTSLVLNGYEQKYFSESNIVFKPNELFTIRHIGTAYDGFDFSAIVNGILMFKQRFPLRKFKIEIIGTNNKQIEKQFSDSFSKEELVIVSKRIPKEEVVQKTINSDVLLLAWNLYKGNYGTKLFDYLASGSHILLSPPDNSVVEDLIRKCENGSVAYTSDEVCAVLEKHYLLWEQGKNKTPLNPYPQFARENIAKELYQELKNAIDVK